MDKHVGDNRKMSLQNTEYSNVSHPQPLKQKVRSTRETFKSLGQSVSIICVVYIYTHTCV